MGECPELPEEEQKALNDTRATWPYAQPVVCCAFPDRPFELMLESECTAIGAVKFEWPIWEADYGCIRPPSRQDQDPPVCCFFTDNGYLRSVKQSTYTECIAASSELFDAVPLNWYASSAHTYLGSCIHAH